MAAKTKGFSAKLGELTQLPESIRSDDDAAPSVDLDPLPSLDPPEDTRLVALSSLTPPRRGERLDLASVRGAASALAAIALGKHHLVLCVTAGADDALRLAADLAFFAGENAVVVVPAPDASPYAEVNPDRRSAMARIAALARLAHPELSGEVRFVVAAAAALARRVVSKESILAATVVVRAEEEIDRDALARALSNAGYLRVPVVEDPGSFAVRGALVDVWPPSAPEPVRIELYGDLVLSLKHFDPDGQRTGASLTELVLVPVREGGLDEAAIETARGRMRALTDAVDWPSVKARQLLEDVLTSRAFFGADGFLPAYGDLVPLTDYLPRDVIVCLEDPPAITSALRDELGRAIAGEGEKERSPHFPVGALYVDEAHVTATLADRSVAVFHRVVSLGSAPADSLEQYESAPEHTVTLDARDNADLERAGKTARGSKGKEGVVEPLARRIAAWSDAGFRTILSARTETQAERLTALLRHAGVTCRARLGSFLGGEIAAESAPGSVTVAKGGLARGAVLPGELLAFVTEEEVFGQRAHRRATRERKAKSAKPFLEDLRALSVGDFVVHVEHGIGRYHGLVHREVAGHTVDLLCVEYAGGDKLYLPVYRLNQIQKLAGADAAPKMDRLGGSTFAKTKQKVEKHVRQMADELLRLYAERQAATSEPIAPPDDEYRAFEATFPFEETPDQAKAIGEVLVDLELPRPMDRLVCGDVGFGKTEVAIRAAFRVAMAGRQVAVLCPTTVLAQQHFLNLEARFRDYPIKVAALSRFQTKSEQDQTMREVKEGKVDVIVGTHRLLSKDIHWKRLGLLVVDEEQRFGVTHKERIKQMRTNVDVLTLSATPIPRTLQMAVSGLRDMSLITTAPIDRRAIRTIVMKSDDGVLREAVTRELSRGGQVFFVYNRVEGLYERAAKLQALIPSARIAVAHGQMSEQALESAMIDFVDGRFDVLCATAIIESGLDIPRANTIIIDRADMFGLSQLYQLRGRVGRAKERAYCYLVVPPVNAMTDEARARIEALERHTELGSGFQIASLDLELRGAGDLLGAEQSGAVATVGFDLFCHMLEAAVADLRGEPIAHEIEPDLSFDVEALLPESYVDEVGVRLSLYKRLASAESESDVTDLATEMEDRFGAPPPEAKNLIELMRLKTELRRLRVLGCEANARRVTLHLAEDTPLDPAKVLALVQKRGSPYRLTPDMRLTRHFPEGTTALDNTDAILEELAKARKESA